MEEDIEPTAEEITAEPLLQVFKYKHLQHAEMRAISRRFCELAKFVASTAPRNPERDASLRKLREAKDTAVTALIWK